MNQISFWGGQKTMGETRRKRLPEREQQTGSACDSLPLLPNAWRQPARSRSEATYLWPSGQNLLRSIFRFCRWQVEVGIYYRRVFDLAIYTRSGAVDATTRKLQLRLWRAPAVNV